MSIALPAQIANRALAILTASMLVLAALVTGAVTAGPASASTVEDHFTSKLNHARTTRGIPALHVRAALVKVAREQALRMANKNRLYHNPHLTTDVKDWKWVGENVGFGPSSKTVHRAFMHSAPHRANILDRHYTQVGIGAVTRNGRIWVAQVFKRPMKQASYQSFTHTQQYAARDELL